MGNEVDKLKHMLPKNKVVAYIPNALDFSDDEVRRKQSEQGDIDELQAIGLTIKRVDLREFFDKKQLLEKTLDDIGVIWVRGGNTFVLRQAMHLSGLDTYLKTTNRPELLYGAYSAGVCVLGPTLHGIDLMDHPDAHPYPQGHVIWKGLGILPYTVIPHFDSDHPESNDANKAVAYMKKHSIPFKTLRDGEVIIIEQSSSIESQ